MALAARLVPAAPPPVTPDSCSPRRPILLPLWLLPWAPPLSHSASPPPTVSAMGLSSPVPSLAAVLERPRRSRPGLHLLSACLRLATLSASHSRMPRARSTGRRPCAGWRCRSSSSIRQRSLRASAHPPSLRDPPRHHTMTARSVSFCMPCAVGSAAVGVRR
jgi:hypothetical protein